MQIFVSGSLAYDRIMDFPGRFADHLLPEKNRRGRRFYMLIFRCGR